MQTFRIPYRCGPDGSPLPIEADTPYAELRVFWCEAESAEDAQWQMRLYFSAVSIDDLPPNCRCELVGQPERREET